MNMSIVCATEMSRELIKRIVLICLLMGVGKCLQDDERNAVYGSYSYISPIIEETIVGEPQNLTCTAVSAYMIYVNWDPPPGSTPKNYKIEWISSDGYENPTPTPYTEYNMTDLLPCTHYTISVRSSDGTSESDPAEVTCDTFPPSESPPPTDVLITSLAPDKAIVNWNVSTPGCRFVNYSITWEFESLWGEGQASGDGEDCTNSGEKEYIIRNLTPYSKVTACVSAALENVDFGQPSCNSGITMQDSPGPPTVIGVTQENELAIVTWKPPDIQNGVIENYNLAWKKTVSEENSTVVGNVLSYNLTLPLCETYYFSVSAKTAAEDWGPPSNEFPAKILNYIPADKVICSSNPDESVTVSWTTASSKCPVSGFHAEYNWTSLWSEDADSKSLDLAPDNMEFKVREALPYSRIYSCVSVGDKLDNEVCCSINTAQDVPGQPENMTHGNIVESEVNVTWSEPTEINGILGSWILSLNIEDEEVLNVTLLPETRSYELVDLLLDTDYNVTLQASTEAGYGDAAFCIISIPPIGVEDDEPNLAAIIGGTVGVLLGIVVIVGAVFFGRKWKARKAESKHNEIRKERQMTQTSERNVNKASNEEFVYGTKPFPNSIANKSRVTSTSYDNQNFKMPSSDTTDDLGYKKPSTNDHDNKQNIQRPMPEAFNNQYIRRFSLPINETSNFRRPSVDTNETRNFRRPLEDIDEINDVRRPSVDTNITRNFRRPSVDTNETRNFRRPLEDIDENNDVRRPSVDTNESWNIRRRLEDIDKIYNPKKPSTDVNKLKDLKRNLAHEMRNFRRPSTDTNEIQNFRRPSTDTHELNNFRRPSVDTNEMQNFRRPSRVTYEINHFRRPSTDTNGMQNIKKPYSNTNEMQNSRRPSLDTYEMQNSRRPSTDVYNIQNFKHPEPDDNENKHFRKPSPLAYDSRNFRKPAPLLRGRQNLKRPAPRPNDQQNFRRPEPSTHDEQDLNRPAPKSYDEQNYRKPVPRSYDEQNFRRPSSDLYGRRDSKVSLSTPYKDEDVESIDL